MSVIDVNTLLNEISPDAPAGEDLEYDPAFGELERAAEGKPEQVLGDSTVAAEPSDWRTVRNKATELLGRSKDLRVGVYLTRALVNTDGLPGLSDGLSLVRGLLERYWDNVHPQLDPDDNNDPTFRVNTIITLCDRAAMLNSLRSTPLVSSRALGRFGLHDIAVAKGELPAPAEGEGSVPDLATIDAAFMDADLEELQATADAVTRSAGDLSAIDAVLMDKIGSTQAPDLDGLAVVLKEAQAVLNEHLAKRGVGETAQGAGDSEGAAAAGTAAPARAVTGEILSREDAVRMMDKIGGFFERNEPSSPVPLLMKRAKKLVSMSFMDILADMAPDGVKQAKNISGADKD